LLSLDKLAALGLINYANVSKKRLLALVKVLKYPNDVKIAIA